VDLFVEVHGGLGLVRALRCWSVCHAFGPVPVASAAGAATASLSLGGGVVDTSESTVKLWLV